MIDIKDFCINYLSVEASEYENFIKKNGVALRQILRKYGKPLSEKMNSKTRENTPYIYGTYDYEFMLRKDFGKYGGTQTAKVVEAKGDIVVYTFLDKKPPSVRKTTAVISSPGQSMLSTIKIEGDTLWVD